MKIKATSAALALTVVAMSQAQAQAQGATFNVGLRTWVNKWTSWDVYPPLGSLPGASENFTSGSRLALLPSVSVRMGDLLVSGSYFVNTKYSFNGNGGAFSAKRHESDALVGYYVLPTLALTLGYKSVKQEFGPGAEFKYGGPILGAVGSAPLTAGFSLYGSFGYGRVDARLPVSDADGRSKFGADYLLGEVGLAYSLGAGTLPGGLKAAAVTLGYRNQVLATTGYRIALGSSPGSARRNTDLRDVTEGVSVGLSASF